jgi:N6-adenosine-specific RNA methylase IME4
MDFDDLPKNHFGAILADPPWHFQAWYSGGKRIKNGKPVYDRAATKHYETMKEAEIAALPVGSLAAENCVLFLWICWPTLEQSLRVMQAWGFTYKTCAFAWMKGNATQIELFDDAMIPDMLLGYWTRSNTEMCLLGTKGNPKRTAADIRQAIFEPRRQHSRKPDGIYERIEALVAGPYLELFARRTRREWTSWGNQVETFQEPIDPNQIEMFQADDWNAMWSKPFNKPEYIAGNGNLSRRLETLKNLDIIEKS